VRRPFRKIGNVFDGNPNPITPAAVQQSLQYPSGAVVIVPTKLPQDDIGALPIADAVELMADKHVGGS
jgi:hypothetical protein